MRRALTVVGIIVLLFGLALVAAPYWLGMQTESAFNDAIKGMSARSGVPSQDISFSRGWLSSEANNVFRFPGVPFSVTAVHEIDHGPLPVSNVLKGELVPALARIDTILRLSAAAGATPDVVNLLKDLPPIRIATSLDLSGNGESTLLMDAASHKQKENSISWVAGSGEMTFDREWKKIFVDFGFPSFSVQSAQGNLTIKNVRFSSDLYEGTAGYMFGKNSFAIGSISMKPFLDVNNVDVSAIMRQQGKFATINIGYSIGELQIAKDTYGPGRLNIVIRNLDAKTLKQFEDDINKMYGRAMPQEQLQMMVAGKFLEYAGKLTRDNPEIEITKLSFVAPGGELTGKARFVIQGKEQDLSANPMLIVTAIKGSAEMTMPESLAKAIVMPQIQRDITNLKREGKLSATEAANLTAEALDRIAQEAYPGYLQESGLGRWFIRENNNYQFSLTVDRGKIIVNGVPLQPGQ